MTHNFGVCLSCCHRYSAIGGEILDSSCGSVGGAVASNSWGPQLESSYRKIIILNFYCQPYWKDKIKKRGREWPILKKRNDIFSMMTYRCELECSKLNHTTTHSQHFVIWGDQDREGTTDNDYKSKYRQQHKTLNINHMFKIQSVKNNIVQFVFSILWKSSKFSRNWCV